MKAKFMILLAVLMAANDKLLAAAKLHESNPTTRDVRELKSLPKKNLKSIYINEVLDAEYGAEGRLTLFENGPMKVELTCYIEDHELRPGVVRTFVNAMLVITIVNYDQDMIVFGDIYDDEKMISLRDDYYVLTSGVTYQDRLWRVKDTCDHDDDEINDDETHPHDDDGTYPETYTPTADNNPEHGAVWTSTGHYLGWDGDSMIGLASAHKKIPIIGGNCAIAGVFHYSFPDMGN